MISALELVVIFFASMSAASFPFIPIWDGTHVSINLSLLDIMLSRMLLITGVRCLMLPIALSDERLSEHIKVFLFALIANCVALNMAKDSIEKMEKFGEIFSAHRRPPLLLTIAMPAPCSFLEPSVYKIVHVFVGKELNTSWNF